MAKPKAAPIPSPDSAPPSAPGEYTVVARRYRPQQFADLIGQEHVSKALVNALQTGRVAHAYLFTGARGVGKTSAARILAKALNCETGPTATPCDECESCRAVAEGQDVDVVEIDGASNNKVDEARDLRQNVGFRPTRGRYKVYIIDEVHMLSTGAFNALLKTLEEPPPHVKFILATTEIQKIPITILSRCQRFDFAHVGPGRIFDQLKNIVAREGLRADDDALRVVARRANGSMRDSQSLLDQLLSASPGKLTAEQVHAVLGTAGDERVAEVAAAVLARDPAKALNLLGEAADRGLQLGELTDQLIEHWRALMLVSCGGPDVRELPITPTQKETILAQAKSTTLDTILAGLDVLTTTKARMRGSPHLQVLLELAVVRLARMDEMLSVGQLLQSGPGGGSGASFAAPAGTGTALQPGNVVPTGGTPAPQSGGSSGVKKNGSPAAAVSGDGPESKGMSYDAPPLGLTPETVGEVWALVLQRLEGQAPLLFKSLRQANLPAIFGPNSLAVPFPPAYSQAYDQCATGRNAEKVQDALRVVTGQPATVRFELRGGPAAAKSTPAPPPTSTADRRKGLMAAPMFRRASEALGAQLWHADDDFDPTAVAPPKAAAPETDPDADPDAVTDPDEA